MAQITMIYGPPGTGKTTRILELVESKIAEGADPKRIGIVSFTKAASREIAKRVRKGQLHLSKWVCTVHSMAFKVADISSKQVIGKTELLEFSKLIGVEIEMKNPEEKERSCRGDEYLNLYTLAKARQTDFKEQYRLSDRPGTMAEYLYFCENYETFKRINGYVDFSDMIEKAFDCENQPDIDVLFVDEAQDLSTQQWGLVNKWMGNLKALYLAGDDDQSIYGWGGAEPNGMYQFEKENKADREVLDQSYRVPKSIQYLANSLISTVKNRVEKKYKPREGNGTINVWDGPARQMDLKHDQDTLVIYRNHKLRKDIEQFLIDNYLPYTVLSGTPGMLQSRAAKAVKLWQNISDNVAEAELSPKQYKLLEEFMEPQVAEMFSTEQFYILDCLHWTRALNIPIETAR